MLHFPKPAGNGCYERKQKKEEGIRTEEWANYDCLFFLRRSLVLNNEKLLENMCRRDSGKLFAFCLERALSTKINIILWIFYTRRRNCLLCFSIADLIILVALLHGCDKAVLCCYLIIWSCRVCQLS